jgi:hypothetical protein
MSTQREFEEWYLSLHGSWPEDIEYVPKSESGLDIMYSDTITQSMWLDWQAAQPAIPVNIDVPHYKQDIAELKAELAKYPLQPMIDSRFEANPIIDHMLNYFDLNKVSIWCQQNDIDNKYQEQLAQLIGYSLGGYGDLSYVSDETYDMADEGEPCKP